MDDLVVDRLARRVGMLGSRRSVLTALAGTGFAAALGMAAPETEAKRKRRKKKKKPACIPEARAVTCAGKCGSVTNNCQTAVNCGDCPVCQRCNAASATCGPDPNQQGDSCGQTGQVCLANGACACDASSCGGNTVCIGGFCQECGLDNDPCCAGSTCRQSFFVCTPAGICVLCGRDNEPCCRDTPTSIGTCDAGRVCLNNDTCVPCGNEGQPCCTVGNPCGSGLTCSSGTCIV